MKTYVINFLFFLVVSISAKAQLTKKIMCDFSFKLYERRAINFGYGNPKFPNTLKISVGNYTYIGVEAISNYFMQQAYHDFSQKSIKDRFGRLCSNTSDFDKFIYQILIEGEGKQRIFMNVSDMLCGDNLMSAKLYSYLSKKYSNKISEDVKKIIANDKSNENKIAYEEKVKDSVSRYGSAIKKYYNKLEQINASKPLTKVAEGHNDDPEISFYKIPEFNINIYPNGKILKIVSGDSIMHLNIKKNFYLEKLFYSIFNNELIVYCEFSDVESGYSSIQCINLTTKQIKWNLDLDAFSLSTGLLESNYVYIACIGEIAKVDLTNGKFVWKNESLYERYKCNYFIEINCKNNLVTFTAQTEGFKKIDDYIFNPIVNFICDKTTGKIKRINKDVPNDD